MMTFDRDPIFAILGTDDLVREREVLSWDLLECQQSDELPSTKANGIAFIQLQIDSIDHELIRRERLRALPGAPAWPSEPTEEMRNYWRQIKDQVQIPDFWVHYFPAFPLKQFGRNWRGPCPIHGGKNETSMSIFNGGRNWHCFTCDAKGDVFTLAGLVFQTTRFREIANRLAVEFGIEQTAADYSRNGKPYRESISGIVSNAGKKRTFEPFERRNGGLVRV